MSKAYASAYDEIFGSDDDDYEDLFKPPKPDLAYIRALQEAIQIERQNREKEVKINLAMLRKLALCRLIYGGKLDAEAPLDHVQLNTQELLELKQSL